MFGWYYGSGSIEDSTIKDVTFTAGSTCNGAIGGYQHNSKATISNVSISNVKNSDGTPLLEPEAKIGDHYYASLEAAAEASDIAGANVVIDIIADITLDTGIQFTEATNVTINGNGHTITMVDNPDDNNYSNPHENTERPTGFSISSGNSEKEGSVFNINNMTIVNKKNIDRYSSGHSWRAAYYAYAYAETTNYTNVDFIGGVSVAQNASFTDCTFTEDRTNMFMVFVDQEYSKSGENVTVTVDGCSFDFQGDAYGTFKAANKDAAFNLTVTNSEFLNCDNIPAITVDTNVTGIVENCVFENCAAGSYGSEAWVNGGPVPAVPKSGSLNGVPFGTPDSTVEDLGDVESIVGEDNNVHTGSVEVVFEEVLSAKEGEKTYDIYLVGSNKSLINRLNSVDLSFVHTKFEGATEFEIIASNSEVAINPVDNSKVRYEFHYNGKDGVKTDTANEIQIGQVKFTGYGKFSFAVDATADTNAAHATTLYDNIVESFVPNSYDGVQLGELVIDDETIKNIEIAVPTRKLTIDITCPNAVKNNVKAYQDMTVTIVGGTVNETIALGTDGTAYNFTKELPYNAAYTVTVSGAGYRTARYTVTMTEDKTLRFWNNVRDEAQTIEVGKETGAVNVTYLAGDIVKDNKINIYDLSAVVSYFGTTNDTTAYSDYAKYDLDRNGVIDSKDVAYVLVSWGN